MFTLDIFWGKTPQFRLAKTIASEASERNPMLHFTIQGFQGRESSRAAFLPALHPPLASFSPSVRRAMPQAGKSQQAWSRLGHGAAAPDPSPGAAGASTW